MDIMAMLKRWAPAVKRQSFSWFVTLRHDAHYYGLAALSVAVAGILRHVLDPFLGPTDYPFFLFNLAVLICSWYGTLGSSLFSAVFGGLIADYFFVTPRYTIGPSDLSSWIALCTYLLVSVSIALFAEGYRRAIRREASALDHLTLALSAANAATFDYDPQKKSFTGSDEYFRFFGFPRSQSISLATWFSHIHTADRERVADILATISNTGREHAALQYRIVDSGGRLHWVHAHFKRENSSTGETHIIGVKIDVSDLKRAEAALIRSEKLSSAAKLAATVAHEINNPLTAATNLIFLAKSAPNPAEAKSFLDDADLELARVAVAARRTLAFYKEHTHPTVFDVTGVVRSAALQLAHKIEAKNISVENKSERGMLVSGVSGELLQAFSNLIANSVDAVPMEGKIRVHVLRIRRNNEALPYAIRVWIGDNGPGIKPADREKLFEPFFSTKGAAGTGLGLWVTRDIIHRHGGTISLRTRSEGKRTGTLVCITVPAVVEPVGTGANGRPLVSSREEDSSAMAAAAENGAHAGS